MAKQRVKREIHGESKSPLWNVWNQMLCRCYSETHTMWRYYGGRGIRVCGAWHSYTTFRDWAIANGYKAGLTIDRIKSDLNLRRTVSGSPGRRTPESAATPSGG